MELNTPRQFVKTHKKRYANKNCGDFQFLFFIKKGIEPFERFIKFQAMVHLNFSEDEIFSEKFIELLSDKIKTKRIPSTLKHITVFLNEDEEPSRTFFIGFKKGSQGSKNLEKISLLYINIVHENQGHKMILQSSDVEFWNDLDRKWEESRHSCKRIPGSSIFDKYIALVKKKNGEYDTTD